MHDRLDVCQPCCPCVNGSLRSGMARNFWSFHCPIIASQIATWNLRDEVFGIFRMRLVVCFQEAFQSSLFQHVNHHRLFFFVMAIRLFQNVGRSFVTCGRCQVGMFFLGAPELMVARARAVFFSLGICNRSIKKYLIEWNNMTDRYDNSVWLYIYIISLYIYIYGKTVISQRYRLMCL